MASITNYYRASIFQMFHIQIPTVFWSILLMLRICKKIFNLPDLRHLKWYRHRVANLPRYYANLLRYYAMSLFCETSRCRRRGNLRSSKIVATEKENCLSKKLDSWPCIIEPVKWQTICKPDILDLNQAFLVRFSDHLRCWTFISSFKVSY